MRIKDIIDKRTQKTRTKHCCTEMFTVWTVHASLFANTRTLTMILGFTSDSTQTQYSPRLLFFKVCSLNHKFEISLKNLVTRSTLNSTASYAKTSLL